MDRRFLEVKAYYSNIYFKLGTLQQVIAHAELAVKAMHQARKCKSKDIMGDR